MSLTFQSFCFAEAGDPAIHVHFEFISRPKSIHAHGTQEMADDLFAMVTSGRVDIRIDQRFKLSDVAEAHRSLEARKTTGSTILTL